YPSPVLGRGIVAALVLGGVLSASAGGAAPGYVLAIEVTPTTPATLSRVNRLSLARIGPKVVLGEVHSGWAISPDGSRVAIGISAPGRHARIGVRVVDLRRWKAAAGIETGIAAEALWWPTARRLVAVVQR